LTATWGVEVELFHPHLVIYKPICRYQLPYKSLMRSTYIWEASHSQRKKVNMRKHFAWKPRLFLGTHDFLFGTYDFLFGTHDFFLSTHDFFLGTHDFLPTTFHPRLFTHDPRHSTHDILPTTHDC
jgi:hypothetical protein